MKARYALLAALALSGCVTLTQQSPDGCETMTIHSSTLLGNVTGSLTSQGLSTDAEAGGQNAGPLIASIMSALAAGGVIAAMAPAPRARAVAPALQMCTTQPAS
jgi:hypothetical protein